MAETGETSGGVVAAAAATTEATAETTTTSESETPLATESVSSSAEATEQATEPSSPSTEASSTEPSSTEPAPVVSSEEAGRAEGKAAGSTESAALEAPQAAAAAGPTILAAGLPLVCSANYFYSISSNGTLRQVANGVISTIGQWSNATSGSNVSSANGIAIGANGSVAYAYERGGNISQNIDAILRYTPATGTWEEIDVSLVTGNSNSLVTGAVNLSNGRYLFGGFDYEDRSGGNPDQFRFMLYEFNPATNAITTKGYFWTGVTNRGVSNNGDMAFDTAGNLYVVRSSGGTAQIFTVTKANLDAASGGVIPTASTNTVSGSLQDTNGMAFEQDGSVYLGNGSTVNRYNSSSWTNLGQITNSLDDSTDLASCQSPATLKVQKNVVGRVNATDQFTMNLLSGATTVASVTTTGTATGIQPDQIGPVPAIIGNTFTFNETMASGSAANYTSAYICRRDDTSATLSSGNGTSGSVTIPQAPGLSVTCVFTNSPLLARVTINKTVQDVNGQNPAAGVGWTVGAAVSATTGSVTSVTPPGASQVTNASGAANWNVLFATTASRATVTVSETQQPTYQFVSGQCVITGLDGNVVSTTNLSSEAGVGLTGVKPGDSVVCTYVNKVKAASLTVNKSWNVNGTVFANGAQPAGLSATLVVTKGGNPVSQIWGQTNTALATGDVVVLNETTSVTGLPGCQITDKRVTSVNGQAANLPLAHTATLIAGANTYTITNMVTCTQTLNLVKQVTFGSAQPNAFTVTATAPGQSTVTGAGTATGSVTAGIDYTLQETGGPATYVPDGNWACVRADDPTYTDGADGNVRVPLGATVTCTVKNTTAKLVLLKNVVGGSASANAWNLTANPGTNQLGLVPTTVAGAESGTAAFEVRPGHEYTISEALAGSSDLAYILTDVQQYVNDQWVSVNGDTTIDVAAGQTATYRFVNTAAPTYVLPLTGGTGPAAYGALGGLLLVTGAALAMSNRRRTANTVRS